VAAFQAIHIVPIVVLLTAPDKYTLFPPELSKYKEGLPLIVFEAKLRYEDVPCVVNEVPCAFSLTPVTDVVPVIVLESAASIHRMHPGIVVGSKFQMFLDVPRTSGITYLEQNIV
jgi:hypothetical protein